VQHAATRCIINHHAASCSATLYNTQDVKENPIVAWGSVSTPLKTIADIELQVVSKTQKECLSYSIAITKLNPIVTCSQARSSQINLDPMLQSQS